MSSSESPTTSNASANRLVFACLAGVSALSIGTAIFFAGMANQAREAALAPTINWQNLPIADASAAVRDDAYSIATGPVSEQGEGMFVLDHNSGLLQCLVIYPRLGRFMASYSVNVADALGAAAKGGKYLMVTGSADFQRASNNPVAQSVVYVLDTGSGNYACYGIPFDRVAMNANRPQQGLMVMIAQGTANPVVDRDAVQ